jgi:hypothetical protein
VSQFYLSTDRTYILKILFRIFSIISSSSISFCSKVITGGQLVQVSPLHSLKTCVQKIPFFRHPQFPPRPQPVNACQNSTHAFTYRDLVKTGWWIDFLWCFTSWWFKKIIIYQHRYLLVWLLFYYLRDVELTKSSFVIFIWQKFSLRNFQLHIFLT